MKGILFISGLLFLMFAQNPKSKVTWDKTQHDLGRIKHQEPTLCTFVFTNITKDSIKLDNVRTSCGCTSPIWSNKYVMPGDTSHIVIEYDAHDLGEFYKDIKVFIHKQKKSEKLYLYGEVVE